MKLAKKFAEKVGAELAILNKERPAQQVAEIAYVIGDVKGKTAVIVDDIIDTAGHAARRGGDRARTRAPTRVFAAATHPVLSGNAFENLAASPVRADRRHRHDPAAARRAGQHPRALRAPTCSTDSIRRIFTDDSVVRGLRRREPAVLTSAGADPRRPARGRSSRRMLRLVSYACLLFVLSIAPLRAQVPGGLDDPSAIVDDEFADPWDPSGAAWPEDEDEEDQEPEIELVATATVAGRVAALRVDGRAAIPRGAPKRVRALIRAANRIAGKPYKSRTATPACTTRDTTAPALWASR